MHTWQVSGLSVSLIGNKGGNAAMPLGHVQPAVLDTFAPLQAEEPNELLRYVPKNARTDDTVRKFCGKKCR